METNLITHYEALCEAYPDWTPEQAREASDLVNSLYSRADELYIESGRPQAFTFDRAVDLEAKVARYRLRRAMGK